MSEIDPDFIAALRDASVFAPELSEETAQETFDRVLSLERRLVLPDREAGRPLVTADYEYGTAKVPDDIRIFTGDSRGVLASADHATDPVRKKSRLREGADHGTAGLVSLLNERRGATAIIPIGDQKGNVAVTPNHPVKLEMDKLLPIHAGFLSVHGMKHGKLESLSDKTEIHAIIGLGKTPNEKSYTAAEQLVDAAKDLGLRAVIGNTMRYQTYDEVSDSVELDAEGMPKLGMLAALPPESSTNHAYKIMRNSRIELPAFQVEMTRALRLLPEDMENGWHVDRRGRAMGVHLGYMLMQNAADIVAAQSRQ